jgi:hypothetical protein
MPFEPGQFVRYKPGTGTYGYEVEVSSSEDGRVGGVVVGHTRTRVRVSLRMADGRMVTRAVDAASLVLEVPDGA